LFLSFFKNKLTLIDGSFLEITDSSSLYHVADGETLDGLVL
jgi:hypothetical protein